MAALLVAGAPLFLAEPDRVCAPDDEPEKEKEEKEEAGEAEEAEEAVPEGTHAHPGQWVALVL